jgi:hypothetical protein
VSTGEKLVLSAGDIALFEDMTGEGHGFGSVDGDEVIGLVLSVSDDSPHRQ